MELKFKVNDPLPGSKDYLIRDKNGVMVGEAKPIDRGNAGVLYRASYKEMDRAIKFLSPKSGGDQQAELESTILERAFDREIRLLSRLTHTNIVKIVDLGKAEIAGRTYPYYVMEYIEGETFSKYWRGHSARDFLGVLDELLDALSFLHSQGYCHMDIKEENVIVRSFTGSESHAVLLDLGGAKQIISSQIEPSDKTIFISSEKATRRERVKWLGKFVERKLLQAWGMDVDLYAVGAMIKRALDDQNQTLGKKLENELGKSGRVALDWLIERLTEGQSDDPMEMRHYKSAFQLRADLRRLVPEYTWPLGLPELSLVVGPTAIQLPQERVGLTPDLVKLVNHPVFQRLRNVPQLEYAYLIYPGARQSRFQHVLAAFHLARVFLCRLLDFPEFRMIATPEYIQATLLVALLHDIGHYPLSHMFEDFAAEDDDIRRLPEGAVASDDTLFRSFICPDSGDRFNAIILQKIKDLGSKTRLPSFNELLHERFRQSYALLPKIMYSERGAPPPIPLLHSLVDSAIDIDKVVYLSEDSSATGVKFGQGIDIAGLVESLVPPRDSDRSRGAIAITEDGLAAAEATVLARFWMISRVYWHRTNRAVMAMHKFAIADLMRLKKLDFEAYFENTFFATQDEASALISQWYDSAHTRQGSWATEEVRNPLAGLVQGNRRLYKRLLTISNGPGDADQRLYEKVREVGPYGVIDIAELVRKHLNEKHSGLELRYGDVLVDVPHKRREYLGSNVLVYLDRQPNIGRNLSGGDDAVSALLKGLPDSYEHNVKKCRVFLHPDAMEQLEKLGNLKNSIDDVRGYTEVS